MSTFPWFRTRVCFRIEPTVCSCFCFRWHYDCIERWDSVSNGRLYTVFIFLFTFAIPLLGLGCTYTAIAWKMWRRSYPGNADPERDLVQLRAKRKVRVDVELCVCAQTNTWWDVMCALFAAYKPSYHDSNNSSIKEKRFNLSRQYIEILRAFFWYYSITNWT